MNKDFTAERMISFIGRTGRHRLEDVADEMLAIRELRDRTIQVKNGKKEDYY